MEIWEEFQYQLEHYRSISSNINKYLDVYEAECSALINKISSCCSFEEAQESFNSLHEIQRKISIAKYKFQFPLNDRLRDLAYYLDRDDVYSRKHWYEEFKKGVEWPVE